MNKTINKDALIIIIISIIIILFIIITTKIFLSPSINKLDKFSLDDNSVKKSNEIKIKGNDKAKVYIRESKKIEEISVEEYLVGVVSGEMQVNFEMEALKAQAIAARTYYYNRRLNPCSEGNGADICNSVHCQVYISKEKRLSTWSEKDREKNWEKITEAVKKTEGQVLIYNGNLVKYPQFFSTSSGKTENCVDVFSEDVPYLKSIESLGEEIAPKFKTTININKKEFIEIIVKSYRDSDLSYENLQKDVKIISRTEGGAVKEIKLGSKIISGVEFRKIFSINSANFTLDIKNNEINITCIGYGHGVGMSQWGANVMAKEGKNYTEILKHYYSGIDIGKIKVEEK